ncbi:hypothetical protein ACFV9P_18140 [Streptomyces sp. NPDC059892]|uniref:hypothetical protein n=1 Tax=Streptomyces sp. NPDC059892 TaxID=3346989 RepID=UPI0036508D0E
MTSIQPIIEPRLPAPEGRAVGERREEVAACCDCLAAVIPHIRGRTASLIERDHRGTLSAAHIALVI